MYHKSILGWVSIGFLTHHVKCMLILKFETYAKTLLYMILSNNDGKIFQWMDQKIEIKGETCLALSSYSSKTFKLEHISLRDNSNLACL